MNESTQNAQTSRLAGASHQLGVFAIMLLLLAGFIVVYAVWDAGTDLQSPLQTKAAGYVWVADICEGMAAVAAVAAIVLGILGLVAIRRGTGKIEGRRQAFSGLATATATLLTLLVGNCLVAPLVARHTEKVESSNNLKLLGITMHLYHENYGHFPSAVLRDPALGDRAQPYSWRVALLPALGENELYSQYRRDEPWDSPANKALLARMPRVFAPPGRARSADGLTHYQLLVGPGTAFERPDLRVRLTDFPRGPEQTILVVEAADPVPWTKPEDLSYTPDSPLPKVGGLVGNGFHALFADGSVRWIEAEKQESELRTRVPRNGR